MNGRASARSSALAALLAIGCASDKVPDQAATAGASGSAGQGGTMAAGGAGAGYGGAIGGTGAAAGSAGSSGRTMVAGGAGAVGGMDAVAGSAGNSGGMAGSPGGASGTSGLGGAGASGDDLVSDVMVQVHDEVRTILVVTWTQTTAADQVWLEFSFEGGSVMTSRQKPGDPGAHRDVVLGIPGETNVAVRVVSSVAGAELATSDHQGTTGAIPAGMPRPEILAYDPKLASPDRWMFGAVEDSDACDGSCYYHTTFWVYIIDRQGRVVWYHSDPATNPTSSFQRIARDGEYIWIENRLRNTNEPGSVTKMTLDWEYFEDVAVEIGDCIDVTDHGSILYDSPRPAPGTLQEMERDGQKRTIWSCQDTFGEDFDCYTNTVNWNPIDDTVVLSFPYETTVVEIDRVSGTMVGQYGDAPGSWAFSPDTWEFEFQHFANITPEGTLLVSSHMPGLSDTHVPVSGGHAFMEFTVDRQSQTLIEKWYYNDGPEWAQYKGMAMRLPNGNTLANYGTGGVIREITPDKQTAFHVKFDVPEGDDFFNKMVGNNVLIDDLYALNGGGPE